MGNVGSSLIAFSTSEANIPSTEQSMNVASIHSFALEIVCGMGSENSEEEFERIIDAVRTGQNWIPSDIALRRMAA